MALTRITTSSRKRWKPVNSWRYWNVDMRWCRRYDMRPKPAPVDKLPDNYWQVQGAKMRSQGVPGLGTTADAVYRKGSLRFWWRRNGWKGLFN